MSFIETFLATSTTLFCAWIFNKYLAPWLDKSHDGIKKIIRRPKMGKLILDIEKGSNGGYIITWYKTVSGFFNKPEKEFLTFQKIEEAIEWIKNHT